MKASIAVDRLNPVQVAPHHYRALTTFFDLWSDGRCKHCMLPRDAHPVRGWTRARPLGDRSRATVIRP